MRIPDTETAIRIYYEYSEIGNAEIAQLFGKISSNTAVKLKNKARPLMQQRGVRTILPTNVNTKIAFEAWGIDITDLERRYKRLKALGFCEASPSAKEAL